VARREDFEVRKLNVVAGTRPRTKTFYWLIKKPGEEAVAA